MRQLVVSKKLKFIIAITLLVIFASFLIWSSQTFHFAVLDPKGIVAQKQYDLIVFTTLLGFVVVIPVFIMTIIIAWRYREGNKNAAYTPNVAGNKIAETIWWGVPIVLIVILSVVTWNSTHNLDPYLTAKKTENPITIQVVALDWKWLFIYPEYNIATVNYVQFPVDTPLQFVITSDATMNSFWIPQLGGQIYAMSGMTTKLQLNATEPGDYKGLSANISGEGFADMKFTARATSNKDFNSWVDNIKNDSNELSQQAYDKLAQKSTNNAVVYYSPVKSELLNSILMKYMMPEAAHEKHISPSSDIDAQSHHSEMESH